MEFKFSERSLIQLATVRAELRDVITEALGLGLIDFAVIQGRRSKEEQNRFFSMGRSRVEWPNGAHNVLNPDDLAEAVDIQPVIDGKPSNNYRHFIFLAGVVMAIAKQRGVPLRWGGNWDMDGEPITDQKFQDLYHFELVIRGEKR